MTVVGAWSNPPSLSPTALHCAYQWDKTASKLTDPEEEPALLRSVSLPQSKGLQNLRGPLRLEL